MLLRKINERNFESFFEDNDKYAYEVMSFDSADVKDGVLTVPTVKDEHRVISIGKNAGTGIDVRKIVVPSGIQKIDNSAFEGCKAQEVLISHSVKFIGNSAFKDCTNLKSVAPADTLNLFLHLETAAFSGCTELRRVVLAVKIIPISCFEDCTNLCYILDSRVQEIDAYAFKGTAIDTVEFSSESELRYIGSEAFAECSKLTSVNIETKVDIRDSAFEKCKKLKEASISAAANVGEMVFSGCRRLARCDWPLSVTSIPYGTFCDCPCLEEVSGIEAVTRVGNYAFHNTALKTLAPFKALSFKNTEEDSFSACGNLDGKTRQRRKDVIYFRA